MFMDNDEIKRPDYNVLVIYDITENKRRRKVNKVLESFGCRIQKSAFECKIDNYEFERLAKKLERIVNKDEDVMRIYRFTDNIKVITFGEYNAIGNKEYDII